MYAGLSIQMWDLIHIVGIASLFISSIVSSIIIWFTIKRKKLVIPFSENGKITVLQRFPMLISIGYLLFSFFHLLDLAYSFANKEVARGTLCGLIGFGTVVTINYIQVCVIGMTIYLYVLVNKNKSLPYGKHIWKFHFIGFLSVIVVAMIPGTYGGFGKAGAWCAASCDHYGRCDGFVMLLSFFFNTSYIIVASLVVIIMLLSTSIKLRYAAYKSEHCLDKSLKNIKASVFVDMHDVFRNQSHDKINVNKERRRIALRMELFVIGYLVNWIPYVIFIGAMLFEHRVPVEITLVCVFITNLGCATNCFACLLVREIPDRQENSAITMTTLGSNGYRSNS